MSRPVVYGTVFDSVPSGEDRSGYTRYPGHPRIFVHSLFLKLSSVGQKTPSFKIPSIAYSVTFLLRAEITVIAELRRKGFALQKIRRVLRFLQREMGRRLAEVLQASSPLHLVTDGNSIYLEDQHDRIIDILKNARQPMFLVCVSDQARRLTIELADRAMRATTLTR